jgi:hypothetical protein
VVCARLIPRDPACTPEADRAAASYTQTETAKLNGLDQEDDRRRVLTCIAVHPVQRVDKLLP